MSEVTSQSTLLVNNSFSGPGYLIKQRYLVINSHLFSGLYLFSVQYPNIGPVLNYFVDIDQNNQLKIIFEYLSVVATGSFNSFGNKTLLLSSLVFCYSDITGETFSISYYILLRRDGLNFCRQ